MKRLLESDEKPKAKKVKIDMDDEIRNEVSIILLYTWLIFSKYSMYWKFQKVSIHFGDLLVYITRLDTQMYN